MNLQAADALAEKGLFPQSFGFLVPAAEEAARAYVYKMTSFGFMTFDPNDAGSKQYFNERDLFDHEKKHTLFAALEISMSMIEMLLGALKGGIPALESLNAEIEAPKSKEESEAVLLRHVPSVLPMLNGVPFWEMARQAAHYSGEDARGAMIYAASKEDFEAMRPIIGRRVEFLAEVFSTKVSSEQLEDFRRLTRKIRRGRKGSSPRPSQR